MQKNSLMVIDPYRDSGTWVFDDETTGLVREPFVCGIPEILDLLVKDIPDAQFGFRLIFAACPFPGATRFVRDDEVVGAEACGGTWYCAPTLNNMKGWLCPALFKYFDKAPRELYAKAERRLP